MTRATVAVVLLGLVVATATALNLGFDARAFAYFALMVAVGAVAIGVARRTDRRSVGPVRCAECGGLISPHAPYCKHCKAPVAGAG